MWKRCTRCGNVANVSGSLRRCHRTDRRMGASFYCLGSLIRADVGDEVQGRPTGRRSYAAQTAAAARRPQDVAATKWLAAQAKVREYTEAVVAATKRLAQWQRKAETLHRLAIMTDADVAAMREKRQAAAAKALATRTTKRRTRSVAVGGLQ